MDETRHRFHEALRELGRRTLDGSRGRRTSVRSSMSAVPRGLSRPRAGNRVPRPQAIADIDALDGNAIAGALFEHLGHEMTMAEVRCSHCPTTSMMAELRVYMKAAGDIARCPSCGEVVM